MSEAKGTALVTGASSGIGRTFARMLAARGHDLVVVARRKDRLDELAVELVRPGVEVEVLPADLSVPEGVTLVEQRLADDRRPIDLLVNNAGFGTTGGFARLDIAREEELVRVNVIALVRLTHAALGGMLTRGRGGIINVSSSASFQPLPGNSTYAASKAFVTSFTEAVAAEVRAKGITLTVLCPGFTHTEFHDHGDFGVEYVPKFLWRSSEDVAAAGLDALDRGRVLAVPGWPYRTIRVATRLLPKAVVRRVAGIGYRPR